VDIKSLPAGARCLVDANIFIYHFGGASGESTDFLARVAKREVEAHITTTIIAEVLHRRMTAEAIMKGMISPGKPFAEAQNQPQRHQGADRLYLGSRKASETAARRPRHNGCGSGSQPCATKRTWTVRQRLD